MREIHLNPFKRFVALLNNGEQGEIAETYLMAIANILDQDDVCYTTLPNNDLDYKIQLYIIFERYVVNFNKTDKKAHMFFKVKTYEGTWEGNSYK